MPLLLFPRRGSTIPLFPLAINVLFLYLIYVMSRPQTCVDGPTLGRDDRDLLPPFLPLLLSPDALAAQKALNDDLRELLEGIEIESEERAEQLRVALDAMRPDEHYMDEGFKWLRDNQAAMKRVVVCLAEGEAGPSGCKENETKIALLIHPDFTMTTNGASHGEVIWGEALIHAFNMSGYTTLIGPNLSDGIRFHKVFPSLVKVVLVKVDGGLNYVHECQEDSNCIASESNPNGIPLWKMHGFSYFGIPEEDHPLGRAWVVTPIPVPGHNVIGSSIEHKCTTTPLVPHRQRKHQSFILAKVNSYFDRYEAAWDFNTYASLAEATNLDLVSVARDDTDGRLALPEPVQTLGSLKRAKFLQELSHSKVLLGIGFPLVSPTPYEALCLGVPFINPYDSSLPLSELLAHDGNPRNVQHAPLFALAPPYVYNVPRHNETALLEAVQAAIDHPFEGRMLPDLVSLTGLRRRLGMLMDLNWEAFSKRKDRRIERSAHFLIGL